LASAGIVRAVERDGSLLPYAAYRTALAGLVWARLPRKDGGSGGRRRRLRRPLRHNRRR
jgi:hypothetical protein